MKVAYFDCFSGIAGNMLLAAVIDAGAPGERIRAAVKKVVPGFQLKVVERGKGELRGRHASVLFKKSGQPHRHLAEIEKLIVQSGLPARVQEQSQLVFRHLAEAESRVHGVSVEEVHFHEVGAVDAIVDVVGTIMGLELLGVEEVICSPLPLGAGEVECAHGRLPVPAPAVLELVKGLPVRGSATEAELVTPTGAALAVSLATSFGPLPAMTITAIGTGWGDRKFPGRPNVMRVIVGERLMPGEVVLQMEAAIDDMPPEHFDFLLDRLHEAGALEVLFLSAQMKKNRPGILVRFLVPLAARQKVISALFKHSTTLGVRSYEVERTVLPRETITLATPFGPVRLKRAFRPTGSPRIHVEYDDLKAVAKKSGKSLQEAEEEILRLWRKSEKSSS